VGNSIENYKDFATLDFDKEGDDLDFGPRDPKILKVGVGLKLRDIDVEFKAGQFAYACLWHLVWFLALGPLTALPMLLSERSLVLSKNMGFFPTKQLLGFFII
jgi:hypothetical protein